MSGSSFRDLRVGQDGMNVTSAIYRSTAAFPKDEVYGLRQQILRAAVSVPSNIAEGKGHHADREFVRFLHHARGSLLELQTQRLIAQDLKYLSKAESEHLMAMAEQIGRGLSGLINSLSKQAA